MKTLKRIHEKNEKYVFLEIQIFSKNREKING